MEQKLEETLDAVKDTTAPAYDPLRGRLNEANERLQDLSDSAREKTADAMDSAMDWIRDNPGTSIAIALVLGASLGALITYASKD